MRGLCNLLIIYEIFVPNISSAEFFIAIAPFNVKHTPGFFLRFYAVYLKKFFSTMNEAKSSGKYWMSFLISSIALILMLIFAREYFWVVLPFFFTTFGLAMNII
jgi:hypothetical protein